MAGAGSSSGPADGSPGFLQSLKAVLAALSAVFHTRLELFVTELEEERERLKQTLLLILLIVFGLGFGFILLTIFLVALFWERGWIAAIGGLAAFYLGIGIVAAFKLRSALRSRLFSATLSELAKDRDRLKASFHE